MTPPRSTGARAAVAVIGATAVFAASCEPSGYEPQSKVDTLRVLAVKADLPFAQPGEKVHLTALVADPLGDGRPVSMAWGTCENPGSAEIPACEAKVPGYTVGTATFDVTVPADALDGLPPEAPVGEVGVVFAACAGTLLPAPTRTSPVSCVDAQGGAVGRQGFVWGGKRIVVVPGVRNQNPAIVRVRLDGVIWSESYVPVIDGCPGAKVEDCPDALQHVFTVEVTPESRETYGDQTEDLVAWFFVSQGEVQDDYVRPGDDFAAATAFAPTAADPSRPVEVWFVVRDDRGGVDFTHRSMRLR